MNEAQLIAATGFLAFLLVLPPLIGLIQTAGLRAAAGNRKTVPDLPEWANRAARAQRNMIDSLVPFLALVMAVQIAGASNENTRIAAALFFWGRAAHAATYIAGIPYVRTVAFVVSASGLFRMAGEVIPIVTPGTLLGRLF